MKKIFAPTAILALLFVFTIPGFFVKTDIICYDRGEGCPPTVLSTLYSVKGKSIFSAKKKIAKALSTNYLVSDFNIQYKLPNILKVDIVSKKPVFYLTDVQKSQFVSVGADGYVLSTQPELVLPYIESGSVLPKVADKVDNNVYLALQLIDGVYKMYQVGVGRIDGDSLVVELPAGVRVIFPLVGSDRELLLGSLRLVYARIQSGESGSLFREIDLRYKNPVLR